MKYAKPIIGAAILSVAAGMSSAASHMADELTIISWGGLTQGRSYWPMMSLIPTALVVDRFGPLSGSD